MKNLKAVHSETLKVSKNVLDNVFRGKRREFKYEDVVIFGLFEDMLGKVGSFIKLLEMNDYNVLLGISRMVLENYAYLKYILEKDTVHRGETYFYSTAMNKIQVYDIYSKDKQVKDYLGLSQSVFSPAFKEDIKEKYKRSIGSKKTKDKWYNFNGKINNFRKLCDYLGIDLEYKILYKMQSTEVHAQDIFSFIRLENEKISVPKKTYNPEAIIWKLISFLIDTVKSIYLYYLLPNEIGKYNSDLLLVLDKKN
ncbi:DUF5677 domain-containing protein [Cytobacillus sp. FSL R7-0680]|uniref:DUF5677 domain-containing protein n=1 Tax=Cytobacillus sp. FSL R7-0680 TaxID=2921689 RepID=UPI0030F57217